MATWSVERGAWRHSAGAGGLVLLTVVRVELSGRCDNHVDRNGR